MQGIPNSKLVQIILTAVFPVAALGITVYELDDYEAVSRGTNLIGTTVSASEGVYGQEDLEYRPILRTGEVLEIVPGLIVTQHSGTGKANQYFLRGFNLDHGTDFATFVDGMPVNMVTHAHGQGYSDINFIIPELIDSVSYTKGMYHAAQGDFSSAGSAHIRTVDHLENGLAMLSFGENSYLRAVVADSYELEGGDTLLAGVEGHYYDGPWEIGENLNQYKALAKYGKFWEQSSCFLTLHAYDAQWDSADQIPRRAVEQGLISRFGSIDPDVGGESSRYSLSTDFTTKSGDRITTANAYAIYSDLNLWSNFTYFLDDPANGDEFEQAEKRMTCGANLTHVLTEAELFNRNAQHTFGMNFRYDAIDDIGLYPSRSRTRINNPVRVDDVNQFSLGLYFENETNWTDRLRSVIGLRADYYHFDVASDRPENSGNEDDFIASPKLSLIFSASDAIEMYASAGLGFHSNDARGTTIQLDPKNLTAVDAVDPLVRSSGAEAGIRFSWADKFNSSLSFWWLELDSELLYVGDAGGTEASIGSRRHGIEFSNHYRPVEWLTLDLDLSFTESEFENGEHIPGALDAVLNGGLTYHNKAGFFSTLRGRYFGPRPLIEDGSVESGSTLVFNFRAGYDISDNLRVAIDVLNLFDSNDDDITYYYESQLTAEPAGVEDVHFHPIEPRTLRASLTYRF